MPRAISAFLLIGLCAASAAATAQSAMTITPKIVGKAAVLCIRIDDAGSVSGAFIVTSSGDPEADKDMLAWSGQLHWPAAKPGEKGRNTWFPMPAAFGGVEPPPAPQSCGPVT